MKGAAKLAPSAEGIVIMICRRVLIVDDEAIVAFTLKRIFEGSGYDARSTSSSQEALEIVESWHPALAILDMILPEMNGIELAIKIREEHPECSILLLSGNAPAAEWLEQAQRDGYSFEICAKPIHPTELLAAAEQILAGIVPRNSVSPWYV